MMAVLPARAFVPEPEPVPLFFRVRNSSVSDRTRLRCLSKARNVPVMVRESVRVMRRRCSTYRNSLLPFPLGFGYLLFVFGCWN